MMRRLTLAAAIALLFGRVAGADPIVLSGSGVVSGLCAVCAEQAGLVVAPGDGFTFRFSFNTVSSDEDPADPNAGIYRLVTAASLGYLVPFRFRFDAISR